MTTYLLYYLAFISLLLFVLMGVDKAKAKRGSRRVPEATLFFLAVVGGSLGGMLGMAHFRPGMLDAFLNGFRQSRIPSVKLKAMLTETNAAWSGARLHREIRAEHEQMEAMRKQK